ncbi:MAG: 50S ribosomal protein L19e [Candidatus Thermoplasmatota archaeon]|nr:50S ribosomal protein L19e [Candidatus Thermoplasmatota archaeon]
MDVKYQRRLAADLLDCGKDRVWIDDTMLDEVIEAITREEVRELINREVIRKKPKEGNSRDTINYKKKQKAKGRRKGHGKRKGSKNARESSKEKWKKRIRAIRKELKYLRDNDHIDRSTYRKFYNKSKGGSFEDRSDMLLHLKMEGYIDDDYEPEDGE